MNQNLLDMFYYKSKRSQKPTFHSHPEHEMLYFHEGECKYLVGDECYAIASGSLVMMNGMSRHGPIMPTPCMRTILRFNRMAVLPLLQMPDSVDLLRPFGQLRHYHWRLEGDQKAEIEHILARMNQYCSSPGAISFNRLRAVFLDLLLFVCENSEKPLALDQDQPNGIHDVLAYIEKHYMRDFSLDELAANVNFSKYYMSRLFKEQTGMTVFDYINRRRIQEAKLLFHIDRTRAVTDVCFHVGYKHLTHFSRTFKKIVGLTPEQFRKMV
ncbi:AraC family transcriptional regulator [Paenibacillus sp. GCM10012303]|uniref:helix-turn-helix transcriptional regulator n=1 Tax=Paenibacillus sp. GCM10012303 TaxID=3317340 RepID=UPI003608A8F6